MAIGKIIKSLSGFYYIEDHGEIYQCRGRGNFRKRKLTPLVGDIVEYESTSPTDGMVLEIHERENELVRPPISNVTQALLVFSAKEPEFDSGLVDRFLVHIEAHHIKPVLCITKMDLVKGNKEALEGIHFFSERYGAIGYSVFLLSKDDSADDLADLKHCLENETTVLAGQSGVGKSSLLNKIDPHLDIDTAKISEALNRGKHTTRHVELLKFAGGYVADTPGFSSLDFTTIETQTLGDCFPEIQRASEMCKFRGCTHISEPGCAVKEAVASGHIASYRYEHYEQFFTEISNRKKRY
ncbi:ribosome biogenesis GTPase [Pullulanibacillus pueri]|uniref:Small ribosomal subunit biogenesis GTPase RsgA n=1 Tax=Pullulanibacillus pueri TaxID=1437324 RepID=A0A8J3EKJ1_9BACL|nr:ribosome small subunit-dependent GTPase A [Pullulanibacillus pueri]MBM7680185.1 ribosome biogenesis GTPase [Pullulanibacillus pueri]GGH74785.1 putative ribosome biogenesis GTPase RsgA [Pullulanibacillus pueri]